MSDGHPSLERSVLEGKERDEWVAISEALGSKPAARASKATLVDTILRAAGVDVDAENGAKPKRTRAKKAAVEPTEAPAASEESPAPPTPVGSEAANGASQESSAAAEGQAAVAEASAELSSPPPQQSQQHQQQQPRQ